MGKKGKMSSFSGGSRQGKWGRSEHMNMCMWEQELQHARSAAYDQQALARQALEEQTKGRRKVQYNHLAYLVMDRLHDDRNERRQQPASRAQPAGPSSRYAEYSALVHETVHEHMHQLEDMHFHHDDQPLLRKMCMDVLAAQQVPVVYLQPRFHTLSLDDLTYYMYLAAREDLLDDSSVRCFANHGLCSLYLSSCITSLGLAGLVQGMISSFQTSLIDDDWEHISDLPALQLHGVTDLHCLRCAWSLPDLAFLGSHFPHLTELSLINCDVISPMHVLECSQRCAGAMQRVLSAYPASRTSREQVMHVHFLRLLLDADIFPMLACLRLSYCHWTSHAVMKAVLDGILTERIAWEEAQSSSSDSDGAWSPIAAPTASAFMDGWDSNAIAAVPVQASRTTMKMSVRAIHVMGIEGIADLCRRHDSDGAPNAPAAWMESWHSLHGQYAETLNVELTYE